MSNLQALNVIYQGDDWIDRNNLDSPESDELVNWLYQQLPSTCMITRDTGDKCNIRICIR